MSWYVPEHAFRIGDTWSVKESYPYFDQVDYGRFTVECPGNALDQTDMSSMVHMLESLLLPFNQNSSGIPQTTTPTKSLLEQKQEALSQSVVSFLYGVGPDAHRFDDAFSHLIRSLRSYLDAYVVPYYE